MEITNLKNIKFNTREVEVLDGQFFAVKCVDVEDILEIFGEHEERLRDAALRLDTSSKIRFLITLLQTLPVFLDIILKQCVVNHDDLEIIENVLNTMTTERKINLIITIFDLSWSNIESFMEQMKTAQGKIEMFLKLSEMAHDNELLK